MEPSRLLPMLATAGRPDEVAGGGWAYEFKWDGVRVLAATDGQRLQLRSRQGNDVTGGYPELAALVEQLPAPAVVDGEVVAFDEGGVPSFSALQPRMHLRDRHRVALAASNTPVTLLLFDVLLLDGAWLLDRPYEQRRERLEQAQLTGPSWATPPRTQDLHTTLSAASERGLEGVVAKRVGSVYRPGVRSPDWRKLRLVVEQEFVVGGYRRGQGNRAGTFGALLVGTYDDEGRLHYGGGVGTGFSDREAARLAAELTARERPEPPFVDPPRDKDAVWVDPEMVVQVRFREWTPDGRLRQPAYRGQRTDVDPRAIRRDG